MSHDDRLPLPSRLLALPMYLMYSLTRQGYQQAVENPQIKLRMPQYGVLAALEEFGPTNQKAIAERIGFDKSDVTKILNALQAEGFVERTEDERDRRSHSVRLTAKGRRQVEASEKELLTAMRHFLRGLNGSEFDQLRKLLLKAMRLHDARFAGKSE
jgi:DNA-binding MarR family transcriptional regulator